MEYPAQLVALAAQSWADYVLCQAAIGCPIFMLGLVNVPDLSSITARKRRSAGLRSSPPLFVASRLIAIIYVTVSGVNIDYRGRAINRAVPGIDFLASILVSLAD